jgi:hypothetical protein
MPRGALTAGSRVQGLQPSDTSVTDIFLTLWISSAFLAKHFFRLSIIFQYSPGYAVEGHLRLKVD